MVLYITGLRPGTETEKYIKKILNRVTFLGAMALTFIACLPVALSFSGLVPQSLALGTGLIIVVGVALHELITGKSMAYLLVKIIVVLSNKEESKC